MAHPPRDAKTLGISFFQLSTAPLFSRCGFFVQAEFPQPGPGFGLRARKIPTPLHIPIKPGSSPPAAPWRPLERDRPEDGDGGAPRQRTTQWKAIGATGSRSVPGYMPFPAAALEWPGCPTEEQVGGEPEQHGVVSPLPHKPRSLIGVTRYRKCNPDQHFFPQVVSSSRLD